LAEFTCCGTDSAVACPGSCVRIAPLWRALREWSVVGLACPRQPYTPDGRSVIAVEHDAQTSHLLRLDLETGTRTTIPGSDGASGPDIACDGRIAFAYQATGALATTLRILPATGGVPTEVDGVPSGMNATPSWDPNGHRL